MEFEDDVYWFGRMVLELATGQREPELRVLRDRGHFNKTLLAPQVCEGSEMSRSTLCCCDHSGTLAKLEMGWHYAR